MNKKLLTIIFFILAFLLTAINNTGSIKGVSENSLVVYFLDIGQGDATLIRTPDGNDILIDGGPDNTLIQKLGKYLPIWDRTIETIILTHPDSDHVTGLVEVLRRYDVDRILITGVESNSANYRAFLGEANNIFIIDKPQKIELGGGVYFDVFFPDTSFENKIVENTNNTSIAGKLIYASTSVMFTGDLENEEDLLESEFNLSSNIYKVGHHGASNANDLEFILAVNPKYAVISAGLDNKFGHPNYRTLKNLEKSGAEVFRTDKLGDIIFISDGKQIIYNN